MTAALFALPYVLGACGSSVNFAKTQEASSEAPPPGSGPTPPPQAGATPSPTPPVVTAACPDVTGSWSQVPTRPYPPFQGAPADDDMREWMQSKSPGPIDRYNFKIHWAQAAPYGVWPANEYVAPTENGFLILPRSLMVMMDSTTHGSGCHEGCQWDTNPVWEFRGSTNLLKMQSEGNQANLPNGNVFMLKYTIVDSGSGTFALRARIVSQTGAMVYTPELKFCVKK